jgi:hypothetical protein
VAVGGSGSGSGWVAVLVAVVGWQWIGWQCAVAVEWLGDGRGSGWQWQCAVAGCEFVRVSMCMDPNRNHCLTSITAWPLSTATANCHCHKPLCQPLPLPTLSPIKMTALPPRIYLTHSHCHPATATAIKMTGLPSYNPPLPPQPLPPSHYHCPQSDRTANLSPIKMTALPRRVQ